MGRVAVGVSQLSECLRSMYEVPLVSHIPVPTALKRWRQENQELKVIVGYTYGIIANPSYPGPFLKSKRKMVVPASNS